MRPMSGWMFQASRRPGLVAGALLLAACRPTGPAAADSPGPVPPAAGTQVPASAPAAAPAAPANAVANAVTDTAFVPVMRSFADMVVGCDNTGACMVTGVPAGQDTGMALLIRREAGESGQASLTLVAPEGLRPATLYLDGKALPDAGAWRASEDGLGLGYAGDVSAWLRAAANARWLRLGKGNQHRASLAGLKAALLFVDDRQDRVKTPGAWVGRGDDARSIRPAAAAPALQAAAPVPALEAAQARALTAWVRQQAQAQLAKAAQATGADACEAAMDEGPVDQAYALGPADALVAIRCLGGAYQDSYLMFRADRAMRAMPVLLDLPASPVQAEGAEAATGWLSDPSFADGVLTSVNKGRGLGDCGEVSQWRFDGRQFNLAWNARLDRCGGVMQAGWPVLWRTANADLSRLGD